MLTWQRYATWPFRSDPSEVSGIFFVSGCLLPGLFLSGQLHWERGIYQTEEFQQGIAFV